MRVEVATFKRQATRVLAELKSSGEPIPITEHGKPAGYLVSAELYEAMQRKMRILEGITRGERASRDCRTYVPSEVEQEMGEWLA